MGAFWSDRATAQFIEAAFLSPSGQPNKQKSQKKCHSQDDASGASSGAASEEEEQESCSEEEMMIESLPATLAEIRGYNEGQDVRQAAIRAAMAAPRDDAKLQSALEALAAKVAQIARWHAVSEQLATTLPRLLAAFDAELADKKQFDGATRALCAVLAFAVDFDSIKLATPDIQNDFSFVKRAASKAPAAARRVGVDPTTASAVSLFLAQPSPVLARLSLAVSSGYSSGASSSSGSRKSDADGCRVLGAVASICAAVAGDKRLVGAVPPPPGGDDERDDDGASETHRQDALKHQGASSSSVSASDDADAQCHDSAAACDDSAAAADARRRPPRRTALDACLRVMTAAFVLYDRAAKTPGGAFASGSHVSAKRVATALRKRGADRDGFDSLLAALRYSTLHYNTHASAAVQNIVER